MRITNGNPGFKSEEEEQQNRVSKRHSVNT